MGALLVCWLAPFHPSFLWALRAGLNSAVSNYNSFIGSFETRVLSTGRKFRDLDIETGGKEIEAMEPLDVLARDAQADETRALPAAE